MRLASVLYGCSRVKCGRARIVSNLHYTHCILQVGLVWNEANKNSKTYELDADYLALLKKHKTAATAFRKARQLAADLRSDISSVDCEVEFLQK